MNAIEYSKRLGVITDEQLQAALNRFELGTFVRAEPISFGLFGQNLFVTSTKGDWVLRGCPHYDWQFPAEQFFTNLLHDKTNVPVPYPYLFEPSPEIFGWGYVLMPRMSGVQIADEKLANELGLDDRRGIARALARTLVEAQTLTWDYSGKYDLESGTIEPMPQDYRVWVRDQIRELLARAQSANSNTLPTDVLWAERIIADAQPALETPFQPCILFEDYKEANTVVERTADGWRVTGVFDLMTCHFGDGEADLARQVGMYLRSNLSVAGKHGSLADEFVQEYLAHKAVAPGFAQRQKFYMLYDSVIIWTFWQQHAGGFPEDKTLTLQRWASPFIEFWNTFENAT